MTTHGRILLVTTLAAASGLAFVGSLCLRPAPLGAEAPKNEDARAPTARRDPSSDARVPAATRTPLSVVDPSTAETNDGALAEVRLVVAATGAPAVAAEVWFWPGAASIDGDSGFEGWLSSSTVEEHAASALPLVSDEHGSVRVPEHELGFVVAARSGDLWGYGSFDAQRRSSASVELRRDLALRVRVVDEHGTPLSGATVALARRRLDALFAPRIARTSAPDGIASLRHVAPFVEAGAGFEVELAGLFDPPVRARLESDSAPPIELTSPACGSCNVVLVDANGIAVELPFEARLRFAHLGVDPASAAFALASSGTDGRAVFERVQLGRALAVSVTRDGSNESLEAVGPGPRVSGERVELRVALGSESAVLRARALDSAGVALAQVELTARLADSEAPRSEWRILTGEDGSFALAVPSDPVARPERSLTLVRLSRQAAVVAFARAALPEELHAGSYDLGRLVLEVTPALATGRVVDRHGAPVARARVTPVVGAADTGEPMPSSEGWLAPALSDAHGRFDLHGRCDAESLALVAEKEGLVGEPLEVRSGASGIELVLGAAGSIAGRIVCDPTLATATLLVHAFACGSEDGGGSWAVPCAASADGRFELRDLRAGLYRVSVAYAPTGRELASLDAVLVPEGGSARDERLDPLDLRGRWRAIEIEPVDANGAAIPGASVLARCSGEERERWTCCRAEGARVQVLCDGRPLDLVVVASGFQNLALERVESSRRVELRPAARLRLELGGARPPEPPLRLGLRLLPLGQPGDGSGAGAVEYFDALGTLEYRATFVGRAKVEFLLERGIRGPAEALWLEAAPGSEVEIDGRGGEQVVEVRLAPDALEKALRELRSGG